MKKVLHYINQFFAGIGGEDQADHKPELREGVVGPGLALNTLLQHGQVTHTLICGDNYMSSNTEQAVQEILELIKDIDFDLLIAGPAFQAGRYGVACGTIGKAILQHRQIPVLTSMHCENPGVEMFREFFPIFKGGNGAAKMKADLKSLAAYADKIFTGEKLLSAEEEGYFGRGIRHQVWLDPPFTASTRGVEMLIKKLNGQPYQTELVIPKKDLVPIAQPIADLSQAKIALLTTGGIVPVDNPDHIQSASATRWGRYRIDQMERLKSGEFKTIHAGFDPAAADEDPNRILPLDVMQAFLHEGKIGALHPYFYSTVGTGTTQREASRMGHEIYEHLAEDKVDGALLVAT